jgi:hypothetical protein
MLKTPKLIRSNCDRFAHLTEARRIAERIGDITTIIVGIAGVGVGMWTHNLAYASWAGAFTLARLQILGLHNK